MPHLPHQGYWKALIPRVSKSIMYVTSIVYVLGSHGVSMIALVSFSSLIGFEACLNVEGSLTFTRILK